MITNISDHIEIEEIPESKKFRIKRTSVDECDPEEFVQNIDVLRNTIKNEEGTLKINREKIQENIDRNKSIESEFSKFENSARLWKKENELLAKRSGKDVLDIQERNSNHADGDTGSNPVEASAP